MAPRSRNFSIPSIPRKRCPVDTNSDAGITLDESTGLALNNVVAHGPDWPICLALAKPFVSFFPCGSPVHSGRVVAGSSSGVPVMAYPIHTRLAFLRLPSSNMQPERQR